LPDPADPDKLLNDSRAFTPADVVRVRRPGPVWDGAVKGALIALIPLAIVTMACDCGSSGADVYAAFMGTGAGIGLGIDAAFPPKTVFRRSAPRRTVSVVPTLSRNGGGIAATLRF
jgi:hypothetical protein